MDLTNTDPVGLFLQEDDNSEDDKYNEKLKKQANKDDAQDKTVKLHNLYRSNRKKKRANINLKIQCEECPKTFNHNSSLAYHRLSVHNKTKDFVCNTCGKCFSHKQLLNSHKYVHNDEYFICEACPAKFKSR